LPPATVDNLPDNIYEKANYDELKSSVIDYHQSPKAEMFDKFVNDNKLVGKPSHFLAEMKRAAAKVGVGEDLVRIRFQQSLPSQVGPIIAAQRSANLDELGKLADELLILSNRSESVAVIKNETHDSSYVNNTSFVRNRNLTLTPFSSNQKPKICRAHIFFGANAKNCRSWCQWPNKSNIRVVESRNNSRHNSPIRQENYQGNP
jgi:hypothetical protein